MDASAVSPPSTPGSGRDWSPRSWRDCPALQQPEWPDPDVSLAGPAYLPEGYVSDPGQKLHLYRRLSRVEGRTQVESLRIELLDRFGSLPVEVESLLDAPIRRETEVDVQLGYIGDNIACDAPCDPHCLEPLAIDAAVDIDVPGLIARKAVQHSTELVNSVIAQPRPRTVRPRTACRQPHSQGALTPSLDESPGGLP